jgi:hypothetical protein
MLEKELGEAGGNHDSIPPDGINLMPFFCDLPLA